MIENVCPILRVANLEESLRFYETVLGFKADFNLGDFASVSRDRKGLYLCEGGQGAPGCWVWIGVEDAAAMHAAVLAAGGRISESPRNYPWAYEFRVEDPDGHVLRIGSETRTDMPVETP